MIDEINKTKYLFLNDISEPDINLLKLILQEGEVSIETSQIDIGDGEFINDVREIEKNTLSPIYEITFDEYVTFTVTNESFAKRHTESDQFLPFTVHRSSSYIEIMKELMFVKEVISGPIKHYSICCVDHIIDIISETAPKFLKKNT